MSDAMNALIEKLRYTANAGIPDFTYSKLLDEAADEIERLRTEVWLLQGLLNDLRGALTAGDRS